MSIYVKTGDTIFEQFDGSDEMCKKYHMSYETQCISKDGSYRVPDGQLKLVHNNFKIYAEYGETCVSIGDWIATDSKGKHWGVYDTALRDTYEGLPTISKNVENYLKYCKSWLTLAEAFIYAEINVVSGDAGSEVLDYLASHSNDFALAWIKGYRVEILKHKTITLEDADELRCKGATDKFTFMAEETSQSDRPWSKPVTVYIKENSTGKVYGFDYIRGLSEMQGDTITTVEGYEDDFDENNYGHHAELTPYKETTRTSHTFVIAKGED